MINRYAAFDFEDYYPMGGWNDFVRFYASLEEALQAGHSQIVDLPSGVVVGGNGSR